RQPRQRPVALRPGRAVGRTRRGPPAPDRAGGGRGPGRTARDPRRLDAGPAIPAVRHARGPGVAALGRAERGRDRPGARRLARHREITDQPRSGAAAGRDRTTVRPRAARAGRTAFREEHVVTDDDGFIHHFDLESELYIAMAEETDGLGAPELDMDRVHGAGRR